MKESSPSGNSGHDCERKCPLDAYNAIIELEGLVTITCQNVKCKCNKCEEKSCNRCLCKGVDCRCFLSLDGVVKDARKEEGDKCFWEERRRQFPSDEEREEQAVQCAIDNGETLEEALLHCATEGTGAFVESQELGFDLPAKESSFDEEQESSFEEESFEESFEETDDSSNVPEEQVQDEDGEDPPYEVHIEMLLKPCPPASHMTLKEYMRRFRERQRQQEEGNDEEENVDSDENESASDSPNDDYGKYKD